MTTTTALAVTDEQRIKRPDKKGTLKDITPELLRNMYFERQLSHVDIGRLLNVNPSAIYYWFKKFGIQARSQSDAMLLAVKSHGFTGANNPRWNGGRHVHGGYAWVRMTQHPRATRRGYMREHHLVWEAAHGAVPRGWHVHHKNGDKLDNRLENLEAMTQQKHRDIIPSLLRRIAALETQVASLQEQIHERR